MVPENALARLKDFSYNQLSVVRDSNEQRIIELKATIKDLLSLTVNYEKKIKSTHEVKLVRTGSNLTFKLEQQLKSGDFVLIEQDDKTRLAIANIVDCTVRIQDLSLSPGDARVSLLKLSRSSLLMKIS